MKNIYFTALLLTICHHINAQSTLISTTQEYDDVINTQNNITKINLFDIDFNGSKIPINLIYSHDGIKVMDKPNSGLGVKWQIENIGKIEQIVNYQSDNSGGGWFHTLNPDFTGFNYISSCTGSSTDCSHFGSFNEVDLSPDFFTLSISNGINFDFFYKKNISSGVIGIPTPEFLSNSDGYKINTNFNNFTLGCNEPNNSIVFNIIDKFGNNYNFVNGPTLTDAGRSSNGCRNNYYLSQITNPSNLDFVNIEYTSKEIIKEKFYAVGAIYGAPYIWHASSQSDFDNNIIKYPNHDYYLVDESRFDIKKIITSKVIVDFVYSSNNQYLDEINISDLKGNYISGYKFEYQEFWGTSTNTLYQIKKYNSPKTQSQTLYEFEYNDGPGFYSDNNNLSIQDTGHYEDYFGYMNFQYKTNLLPFSLRNIDGTITPAGDFEPNLAYAKSFSLKSIKNKYGGITEFEYQLKTGNNLIWGNLYGGGIVISSKKTIPIIGVPTLTTYEYDNLRGFTIFSDHLEIQYLKQMGNDRKYFTSIPTLMNSEETPLNQDLFSSIHKGGSFYGTITESNFDFNTMQLNSKIIRQFIPNYEGINRGCLLESETFKNSSDNIIKKNINHYSTQTIGAISAADFCIESRYETPNSKWFIKTEKNISINRTVLTGKTEIKYLGANTIESSIGFGYLNSNAKILRNKIQTTSLGENIEERYSYPQDTNLATEPFVTNLMANNIIGKPLKIELFKNSEKLSETKTEYAQDATTNNLILPKYIFSRKGEDINGALEKKITYDLYDDKGNLVQFTTTDGTPVTLVWGYDKTLLIAKIENATNVQISTALSVVNLSVLNETNLTAINNLRTNINFSNSRVTTYTYIPLVGVSTIIDPKGDTITYTYDSFGRLQNVKDKNGNILSENEYHYKN